MTGENPMPKDFPGPTLAPTSGGKADSLVVLIHGYGANGDDLISLGKVWGSQLPNTAFVAPHGPEVCEVNPSGNQWFDLRQWNPFEIMKSLQALTPEFNSYLDHLLKTYDLPPKKLALVGFSQGAVLALHIALHRLPCAGVLSYSGAFLDDPSEILVARPPVLLIHGQEDTILSAEFSKSAEQRLKELQVPVTLKLLPNLGHGIDDRGLELGEAFLKNIFSEKGREALVESNK